ncbi:MAG: cupin domain-containing protein [Deltaproteobacteria bacterium]|nr:cupin domain-containing protein [Deltaproteobacteria bacterium]
MSEIRVKSIEECEAYTGPHAIAGIRFRHVREALGVSAWGMNVLELDAGCEDYPEHDHVEDGQEEVYVILKGSAVLQANGEERVLNAGDLARVPPEVKRKLVTRDQAVTFLALGGTPGKAYGS